MPDTDLCAPFLFLYVHLHNNQEWGTGISLISERRKQEQRGLLMGPETHSKKVAEPGFKPSRLAPELVLLAIVGVDMGMPSCRRGFR